MGNSTSAVPGTIYIDSNSPVKHRMQEGSRADISGEPAEDYIEENVVMKIKRGRDGRERVENAEIWPFSVHGRLFMTWPGRNTVGSGTIIGPRFVLTAAHNIYSRKSEKECDKDTIVFRPAMSGFNCPYGEIRVVEWFYPEEYKTNRKEDYAILVLEEDIGDYTGAYGIKAHNKKDLKDLKCNIYGYPGDMKNQEPNHHYLWGMK